MNQLCAAPLAVIEGGSNGVSVWTGPAIFGLPSWWPTTVVTRLVRTRSSPSKLLAAGLEFVRAIVKVPGVRRVSLIGSICTNRIRPKDIDFLVVIADDIEFETLATLGRRLKGTTQRVNRGADIFLANDRGEYIGRVCHYRECWPRRACRAALRPGTAPERAISKRYGCRRTSSRLRR